MYEIIEPLVCCTNGTVYFNEIRNTVVRKEGKTSPLFFLIRYLYSGAVVVYLGREGAGHLTIIIYLEQSELVTLYSTSFNFQGKDSTFLDGAQLS